MAETDDLSAFLESCPAPRPEEVHRLEAFLQRHVAENGTLQRPLVLLTSGGTTVPLEKRCVRFIDNFTTGSRGALSAEEFLKRGYAVVFLTREQSYQPFAMDFTDCSPVEILTRFLRGAEGRVEVLPDKERNLAALLEGVEHIQSRGLLHVVTFKTIFDYMKHLEWLSKALGVYGDQVLFYLAAAVSDFYIPWDEMLEHKIQSAEGQLQLNLRGVPKALGRLRHQWAPKSFIVSFKLETDEAILISKAKGAIQNYGVHAVVANLLHNRKYRVLVMKAGSGEEIQTIEKHPTDTYCIEGPLVDCITQMHKCFVG